MRWTPGASHRRILDFPRSGRRHLFAIGGFGGGKSAAVARSSTIHATAEHSGVDWAVLAKTKKQLVKLRGEYAAGCRDLGIPFDWNSERWLIGSHAGPDPVAFVPFVFGEIGQTSVAGSLQGLDFAGAVVDEAPNLNDETRSMLISRLRIGRLPLCFWSGNPGGPRHPFKTDVIDNPAIDGVEVNVPIGDNPSLPPGYVDDLKAAYPLPWQQARYIEGLWAGATGLVYGSAWTDRVAFGVDDGSHDSFVIGADWATRTVTHALLIGMGPQGPAVVDEWRHNGETDGELDEAAQAEQIGERWGDRNVCAVVTDPNSHGLRLALGQRFGVPATLAQLDSLTGIGNVAALLAGGLMIDAGCGHLVTEMSLYAWPKIADQPRIGPVRPDKKSAGGSHGVEALAYGCEAVPGWLARPRPRTLAAPGRAQPAAGRLIPMGLS